MFAIKRDVNDFKIKDRVFTDMDAAVEWINGG